MKVVLAKSAGFCFGVKRAIQIAFDTAETRERIASLGPLIHSPQMVQKLEEKGVHVVRGPEGVKCDTAIVRSHGVTAGELDELQQRGVAVVDATCPFVKKAQDYSAALRDGGYIVVVIGEADHPEVQGIVSYAGENAVIVANAQEAERLPASRRIGIVAQTTQSMENFREVVNVCLNKAQELRLFNTICDATSVRQEEARQISQKADMVLVVGGFNSANTTRLAQICTEIQPRTHHVETAGELQADWFEGIETVGVTAGASTPEWIIREIVETIETYEK